MGTFAPKRFLIKFQWPKTHLISSTWRCASVTGFKLRPATLTTEMSPMPTFQLLFWPLCGCAATMLTQGKYYKCGHEPGQKHCYHFWQQHAARSAQATRETAAWIRSLDCLYLLDRDFFRKWFKAGNQL